MTHEAGPGGDLGPEGDAVGDAATATQKPRRRRWRVAAMVCGGIVAVAAIVYGADVALTSGDLPRGVRIAGVEVGGLDPEEATERVRRHVESLGAEPLPVQAGETTTEIVPDEAGLGVDVEASVAAVGTGSLNPWTRLTSLVRTRDAAVVRRVDDARLTAAVESLREQVDRPVVEGGIDFHEGEAIPAWPQTGQVLDVPGAVEELTEHWADGDVIALPVDITDPRTTHDDVQQVLHEFALAAVDGPVTVTGDGVDAVIGPERIGEIVSVEVDDDGNLIPRFDAEAAAGVFGEQLASTVAPARDATLRLGASGPEVVPSEDGRAVDWEETLTDWEGLFRDDRTRAAVYVDDPAEYTTQDVEGWGVNEVIGEFTTGDFSYASGVNIRKVAAEVNGAVVNPGETFSLNGYTGHRGKPQGYIESGIILDGHADQAVGGGISQFATTLFNASYFAGMEDAGHQEHSYYISRYPAGREATVYEGAIDLRFRNPSSSGVIIESFGDSNSVTVRIWGNKTVDVESINGGRWNPTSPDRITLSGEDCSPSSGAPGFTTSDTRIVRDANSGAEISRDTETTVYDPSPIVTCS